MSNFKLETQAKALSRTVGEKVYEYFQDAGHRKAFEAWYEQKYGKPYIWKKAR